MHLLVTASGKPVEFTLAPAAEGELPLFKGFDLDLPEGAKVYADKSYNDYDFEDLLQEAGIFLNPLKKSKRAIEPWAQFLRQRVRKRIETPFSQLTQFFAKTIHAVTARGFELKVVLFILAFTIHTL